MLQCVHIQERLLINHPMPLSVIVLISCVFIFIWLNRAWPSKKSQLPPSPLKLPVIGHLHYLGTLPHRSLQALSKKYGPILLMHLGSHPTLVISSAEMAREIMKTHDTVFASRPVVKASREIVCSGKDIVFAPYGDYWRHMRKICATNVFNANRVESFKAVAGEEISIMVDKIKGLSGKEVNLSEMIIVVINNIIARSTFGKSLEQFEGAKIVDDVAVMFGAFSFEDLFPCLGWMDSVTGLTQRMRKAAKEAHSLMDEVIEEHLRCKAGKRKDLVDILLECEEDSSKLGVDFTRENIRCVILDIFVAGTETSYATAEWAMAELLSHPGVMKKLQEEVRSVVGLKSKLEEDDINQMAYLKCVIKETLRLHPPLVLSIPRESMTSANVGGYHIPAKTRVLINLWAISRDPKNWDMPDEFFPDRFVNSSVDLRGTDFDFIPFGAGRRGCPGLTFGVTSVEYILSNLLCWFDWEVVGGAKKVDIDMTEASGVSVRLKTPLHLIPACHFA